MHRIGVWGRAQVLPVRLLVRVLHKVLYLVVRNVYGIEIPLSVHLGRRVKISHQSGIVINGGVFIGDDCHLRQNVTIGSLGNVVTADRRGSPVLEDGVYVGAGASIIGKVTVGRGAHIGANATVMTDVPAGATAFARPAQILRTPRPDDTDTPPETT